MVPIIIIFYPLKKGKDIPCATMVNGYVNYIIKRSLWNSITHDEGVFTCPLYFMGDFNSILEAYEHKGHQSPTTVPKEYLRRWSDKYSFNHMPTTVGKKSTWSNRRNGLTFTEKILDRVMFNDG